MIGLYTIRTGDIIHLWNRKDRVDAQTLPFPLLLKLLHSGKVCTHASKRIAQSHCYFIEQLRVPLQIAQRLTTSVLIFAGFIELDAAIALHLELMITTIISLSRSATTTCYQSSLFRQDNFKQMPQIRYFWTKKTIRIKITKDHRINHKYNKS